MAQNMSEVRSLLLPLEGQQMLLPGSLVAEIIPLHQLEPAPAIAPAWLVGTLSWRGQRLPLLSIEAFLNNTVEPTVPVTGRVAVLKALEPALGFSFYGVICQRIPRLALVQQDAVADGAASTRPGVAAELLFNGEPVMIPAVEQLEAALRAMLGEGLL